MFDMDEAQVRFFKYRTARVGNKITLPRRACVAWERELAALAGVEIDNHTVYELKSGRVGPVYVAFSDTCVFVGTELIEERW